MPREHALPITAPGRVGAAILRACEGPDPEVAAWALVAASELPGLEVGKRIEVALSSSADPVARAALLARGLVSAPDGEDASWEADLRERLAGRDPSRKGAESVLAAFALVGPEAGSPVANAAALAAALDAPASVEVHRACVLALARSLDSHPGRLGDEPPEHPELLKTPDDVVRWLAACLVDDDRPAGVRSTIPRCLVDRVARQDAAAVASLLRPLLAVEVDPALGDEAVLAIARLPIDAEIRASILHRARSAPSEASRGLAWIALALAAGELSPDEVTSSHELLLETLDSELASDGEGLAPWVALALGAAPELPGDRVQRGLLDALLRARTPDAFGAAAVAMGMRNPSEPAETALVRALAWSDDPQRTRDLVDAVGAGRCRSAVSTLEALLSTSGDPALPVRVVRALRRMDATAWPTLAERLRTEQDPALRLALLDAAALTEDRSALDALARELVASDSAGLVRGPVERRRAARALASLVSINAWWSWRCWLESGLGSGRLELPALEAWDPPGWSGRR